MPWDRLAVRQLAVLQRAWWTRSLGVSCCLGRDWIAVAGDMAQSRQLRCALCHGDGPHACCLIRRNIFNDPRHEFCSEWVHANASHWTNSMHSVYVAVGQHAHVQGDDLSVSDFFRIRLATDLRRHRFLLLPVPFSSVSGCVSAKTGL